MKNREILTRVLRFSFANCTIIQRFPLNCDSTEIAACRFTHRICTKPVTKRPESPCAAGVFAPSPFAQILHKMVLLLKQQRDIFDGFLLFVVAGMDVSIHRRFEVGLAEDALNSLYVRASVIQHRAYGMPEYM